MINLADSRGEVAVEPKKLQQRHDVGQHFAEMSSEIVHRVDLAAAPSSAKSGLGCKGDLAVGTTKSHPACGQFVDVR